MTIGVYLGQLYATEGGGFTFQETIVDQLLKSNTTHKFVFIYSGDDIFKGKDLGSHTVFRISSNMLWASSFARLKNGIRKRVLQTFPSLGSKQALTYFDQKIKGLKLDLLYITGFRFLETDIPFIYTVWDLQHRLQPFFPEVSADGQWQNREDIIGTMVRRAAYVLTGTPTGKKELQLFYGVADERMKLLLHPTPTFALNQAGKKIELTLQVPNDYIFYPAQFWPHKNHVVLLKALKYIKDTQGRKVNLVLVGHDYGYKKFIQETAAKLGVGDQITMFGFIDRSQLIALYQNARALTYISHFGPENLPPLEAMALGCPVLYGKVNGAVEQLGDAALYVDHLSPEDVGLGILKILDDEYFRNQLISKGKQRASEYTTANYVSDLLKIFNEFSAIRQCWD